MFPSKEPICNRDIHLPNIWGQSEEMTDGCSNTSGQGAKASELRKHEFRGNLQKE